MNASDSIVSTLQTNSAPAVKAEALLLTETTCRGALCAEELVTPHSHNAPGRSTGVVPCLQTFIRDRQRLLRSWDRLLQHLPPDAVKDEERATVSALRQLRQLRRKGVPREER
jgi:hypothetical protein